MLFKSTSLAFVVLLLGVAAAAIQKVNKPNLSKQRDVTNPAIIAAKPKAISSDYVSTLLISEF